MSKNIINSNNQYLIKSKLGNINIIEGIDVPNAQAIILHIHGIGSHFQFVYKNLDDFSERDYHLSKFDYKSVCFEFYGHGKSEGPRCCINNFDDLVDDLIAVILHLKTKFSNKSSKHIPIYLFAESMGAAVCLKFIITSTNLDALDAISGLIFISPMCGINPDLKPGPIMTSILMFASNIIPEWKLVTTTNKMGTRNVINKDFIKARDASPYIYKGAHRLSTARELYLNSLWTPENAHLINKSAKSKSKPISILIFQGLCDKITPYACTKHVFDQIPLDNKELVLLPSSEHCLLVQNNESDLTPNFIIAKIVCWLNNQTAFL